MEDLDRNDCSESIASESLDNPLLRKLFCEVLPRSLNCDLLWITTGGRDFQFVFDSFSSTSAQGNLRIFQIFRSESTSKEDFFGRTYLVKFNGSLQLVAIGLVS